MSSPEKQLIVADAGPLIALAKTGLLDLLKNLFGQVLIPDAVYKELCIGSVRPGSVVLSKAMKWIRVTSPKEPPVRLLRAIDRGEAEAITLAREKNAALLIDETRGRMAARNEGVTIFGTGALLILAKEKKWIPDVKSHLNALCNSGYRISKPLQKEILHRAEEK